MSPHVNDTLPFVFPGGHLTGHTMEMVFSYICGLSSNLNARHHFSQPSPLFSFSPFHSYQERPALNISGFLVRSCPIISGCMVCAYAPILRAQTRLLQYVLWRLIRLSKAESHFEKIYEINLLLISRSI